MIRRALRGLRGRLLLAFVFTSAVTLAVAAAITLSPLQERLRDESATALQDAAEDMRPEFNNALQKTGQATAGEGPETTRRGAQERRDDARQRPGHARLRPARAHRRRARAGRRHGVHGPAPARHPRSSTTPTSGRQASALALAYRALRENASEVQFNDDELLFAMPLYDGGEQSGRRASSPSAA